jgi:hypothetical protein
VTTTRRELALIVPFYAALTVLFTWPAVPHFFSHVPFRGDGVDALSGLYALTWGIHALAHFPFHYFNANVLYPHADSLAYGDHLFGLSVALAPVQWTLDNPIVTYNLAVLSSFVIAATGAYLLGRHVTSSVRSGLLAGLIYGFSAYRMNQIESLDALALCGLPWVFLIGHLYLEAGRRRLIYLGAFFTLAQAVSSTRSLVILPIAAGVALLYSLYRQARRRQILFWRHREHFLAATALFLIGLSPFLKPYVDHFLEEGACAAPVTAANEGLSAHLGMMALFPPGQAIGRIDSPGWIALILIALLATGVLKGREEDDHRIYFYAFLGGLAILMSALLPVPLGASISLSAAVLSALSYSRIVAALRRHRIGGAIASALLVATAVELHPMGIRFLEAVPAGGPPQEYVWLSETDPEAVVVEVPAAPEETSRSLELARRQLYSIHNWRRTVDGVARCTPELTRTIRSRLQTFPGDAALAQLSALHIDYVLVHLDQYGTEERNRILSELPTRRELVPERDFGATRVFRVE